MVTDQLRSLVGVRQIPAEITGEVSAPCLAAVLTAPQRPVALVDEASTTGSTSPATT
jgi:hypothetical protein